MPFLTPTQLSDLRLKSYGTNVQISDKASFYSPELISIGNNVRIDDFSILSAGPGGIQIGNNVHIACYSSLIGKEKILMEDFSGISSRVSIYSSNDDYSGNYLTNPTVPTIYTNVTSKPVILKKHSLVGSGSVILPGVTLEIGATVGALSLVTKSCEEFAIYIGNPAKKLKKRSNNLINLEELYNSQKQ